MNKKWSLLVCILSPLWLIAQNNKKITTDEYIAAFKDIAVLEMHQFGVPASITLSQGILESSSGNSRLAKEGNNHFGIKCKSDWTGKTIYVDDDAPNECFRAYNTVLESYKDHSAFLRSNWRYQELFKLSVTDYKGWAEGLRKAGYATNPKYHEILINLIDRYELHKFDYIQKTDPPPSQIITIKNNDIPAVYVKKGETVGDIAKSNDLPEGRIYRWNDLPKGAEISEGDILYLKPKKRKGSEEFHTVEEGEGMYEISQMYGIKLKHLYKKNKMEDTLQPAVGEKVYMQHKRDRDEPVKAASEVKEPVKPVETKPKDMFVNPNTNSKTPSNLPIEIEKVEVPEFHVVQSGDNIYRIAEKYHVFEEDLLKWNKLDAMQLQLGQKIYLSKEAAAKNIKIETKAPVVKDEAAPIKSSIKYHTVEAGETVYRIITKYGITAEQLQKWNGLKGNNIYEGQKLIVGQ
jgi:LysM repeat protein